MMERRVSVYLVRRKRRLKGGAVAYYYLRWCAVDGREQMKSLGQCSDFTKAQAKAARAEMEEEVNAGRAPARGGGITLGEFREKYKRDRLRPDGESRARRTNDKYGRIDFKTVRLHDMILRLLVEHFGESFRLARIDYTAAVKWYDAMSSGELVEVRTATWANGRKLKENTIRSKIRTAKTIFNWAIDADLVAVSPFAKFPGAGLRRKRPNPEVSLETFRAVCVEAPAHWRAMLGLCRLAGLRRGEALSLPWSATAIDRDDEEWPVGVDWDRKRLSVVIGKGDRYREVPICGELMTILLEAFDQAPEGAERIVAPITENNLERDLTKICEAAGVKPWRKLYQSLRSSCENDWKMRGIAEATYCKWVGHSPDVSRGHYAAPQDAEFDVVTGA